MVCKLKLDQIVKDDQRNEVHKLYKTLRNEFMKPGVTEFGYRFSDTSPFTYKVELITKKADRSFEDLLAYCLTVYEYDYEFVTCISVIGLQALTIMLYSFKEPIKFVNYVFGSLRTGPEMILSNGEEIEYV